MSHAIPRTTRLFIAGLLAVVGLLAVACQVQVETVVEDDGSGYQSIRIGLSKELLSSLGADPDEISSEMESSTDIAALGSLPDSVTYTLINDDESIGLEVRVEFGPTDDVFAALDEIVSGLPSEIRDSGMLEITGGPDQVLRREGDEWVFRSSTEAVDPAEMGALFGDQDGQDLGAAAELFASQVEATYRLHLPGKVQSHNADEVESDGTLVWRLAGEDVFTGNTLEARSRVGGGGGVSPALIVGILVVAGAAAGLGYVYYRRRVTAA